jgi:cystathionine gamma-lyase
MKFETACIHAGQEPDPSTGAIITPIFATSTYVQSGPGEHQGYDYSRTRNPTRSALEQNLAALEGGRFGLAFASGCAAADAIMHLFNQGDHIICCDDCYGGTFRLFDQVMRRLGLEFSFVDLTNVANLKEAIRPRTKAVWVESPTNPLLKIIDLAAVAKICRERGLLSIADNTFATPYFQRPLALGIDIVDHSTTKYLNGHSDVIGGAVVVNDEELAKRLYFIQNAVGGIAGPFDAWLVLRGTKTLGVRMKRHEENASEVARFLSRHPQVERVIYPGLPSHPQHALAREQMTGFGGMVTFVVRGGIEKARAFLRKVKIFSLAESLGGVESLIEHPAIMTHHSLPSETRAKLGISDGMIRASVGIEHIDDLLADLEQALQ